MYVAVKLVIKKKSDWYQDLLQMKVVWKSVTGICGALCVIKGGISVMPE